MDMEKKNTRNSVLDNKKLQDALKKAERLNALSSDPSALAQGVQRSADKLMWKARRSARKVESLVKKAEERKLHAGSKKVSKLGRLVGKVGQIAGRETPESAADVIGSAAHPFVKQIFKTTKGVLDAMDTASTAAMEGMRQVQLDSIEGNRRLKEQTKSIVIERTTSMATKIKTFAKETYGSFLDSDQLDAATEKPIEDLLERAQLALKQVDEDIPDEEFDQSPIDEVQEQYIQQRNRTLDSAIAEASALVGEEIAHEVAVEVFGFEFAEEAFSRRPKTRGLVSGLFGAAQATITGGSQIGGAAIGTAAGLVKSMAVGSDGKTGLAGENGLASTILDTAGNVAGTMLNTAQGIGSTILGNKAGESKSAVDIAKSVANSMVDCVASVGGSLIDGIGEVAKGAVGMVGDAAKGLADFATNAWDAATDMAGGLFDSVRDMLGMSDEEVSDAIEDVSTAAEEMMDDAMEGLDDLFAEEEDDLDQLLAELEEMEDEWDEDDWDEDWFDWEDEDDWEDEFWDDPFWDMDEDPEEAEEEEQQEQEEAQEAAQEASAPQATGSSTTPMGNDSPSKNKGLVVGGNETPKIGWNGIDPDIQNGLLGMMHDGDQQLFNPYGPDTAAWTMYSFRPEDAEKTWPQIAITPSSFEAIKSMRTMLNNVPYVVVKEYFFKNTASMMIDFVKKIAGMVQDAKEPAKEDSSQDSSVTEKSSQGASDAKSTGNSFMDKVKEIFKDIPIKPMVIDLPYILYFCLRQKVYGNTYIFPYIVQSGSTVINEASNASEWPAAGKGDSIMSKLKGMVQDVAGMVGGIALGMAGSQGQVVNNLFPAPSWEGPKADGASFSFDLILINDNVVKTRNNYMCVNTIIHNNRSIQKAILNFPGALYEIWLPTGQRHLMCTGTFKLYPIGLNRMTPNNFFFGGGDGFAGANHAIGANLDEVAEIQNPKGLGHVENKEVVPDAYKLSIEFKSCLANNMNTAVFQYYVEMTSYDYGKDESFGPGQESKDNIGDMIANSDAVKGLTNALGGGDGAVGSAVSTVASAVAGGGSTGGIGKSFQPPATRGAKSIVDMRMGEILESRDFEEITEKFDEATYNKKLGKLRTDVGDQAVNSESAVATIKKAQATVRETSEFLAKLYNAPDNKLWYKEDPKEGLYTTLKPDYRKMLRDKYQAKMRELRTVDSKLRQETRKLSNVESQLSNQFDLEKREELLETKVMLTRSMNALEAKKGDIADDLIQIDTDIIQSAFDEQDDVVSVRKTDVGFRIFQQVWNEKIMNSYEKDKLQYLTSQEKERYFKEKLRELEKFDVHGVLRKPDWFFRVVVLDYIVGEMKRLILWFKDCSWDDFETVYKITRKLRMLQLDVDAAYSDKPFDINHTNLFQVTEEDVKDYTKIDQMLVGNTLYELFSSIVRKVVKPLESNSNDDDSSDKEEEDKEVVMDRKSEIKTLQQRNVRYDVVVRYWGSEAELTKAAYGIVNRGVDDPIEVPGHSDIETLGQLKSKIIELKLVSDRSPDEERTLQDLLGALVNKVATVKEALVVDKMSDVSTKDKEDLKDKMDMKEMRELATYEIQKKDDSVLADVVS